eukprot:Hpha_TRINITY_DN20045_c0_g1::TRINITY_DN20045_c0_g1_i1::g.147812::m.147812
MPSPSSVRNAVGSGEANGALLECVSGSPEQEHLATVARCAVGGTRALESAVIDLVAQVSALTRRLTTQEASNVELRKLTAEQDEEIRQLRGRAAAAEEQLLRMKELEQQVGDHQTHLTTTHWTPVDLEDASEFDPNYLYRIRSAESEGGWVHTTRVLPQQLLFEPASNAATFFGRVTAERKTRWEYVQRNSALDNGCSFPVSGVVDAVERLFL